MVRVGCCAFLLDGYTLEEALTIIKGAGFRTVDISAKQLNGGQDRIAVEPSIVAAELVELNKKFNLTLSEFFVCDLKVKGQSIQPNNPDPSLRKALVEYFRSVCICAKEAGFTSVMGSPGSRSHNHDGNYEHAVQTLTAMVAIAKEYGVDFNAEPGIGAIADSPELAIRLAKDVPGFAYSLDYGHFVAQGYSLEEIFKIHPYARHLHAKAATTGLIKTPFHKGTINWGTVINDLKQRNWDGVIVTECLGYKAEGFDRPVYRSSNMSYQATETPPGMLSHPMFQAIRMAYELEMHIYNDAV